MCKIGGLELKNNLILAPLAGFSDAGFRYLAQKYGAGLTVTEMISAKGLCYDNDNTKKLLYNESSPCAVQFFGSEEEFFVKACKDSASDGFEIIDINMGCPVPKIVKNNEGSALLKNPRKACAIVRAVKDCIKKPVTVKLRLGYENGINTALTLAPALEDSGADMIAVHGRYRQQFYSGKADYGEIKKIVKSVKIPVAANGDVIDKASYEKILNETGADFCMIGRGALGKPYIFSLLQGKIPNVDLKKDIYKHIEILKKIYNDNIVVNLMKKHICCYAKGNKNASEIKYAVCKKIDMRDLLNCVESYF